MALTRTRAWPLSALLVAAAAFAISACRIGYEVLDQNLVAAGTTSVGGAMTSTTGTSGSDTNLAGDQPIASGGAAGAGSGAGCALPSDPGATYAVGEAAQLSGYYVLHPISSDLCVRSANCGDGHETIYEQATCSFEPCQVFQSVARGDGWYSLQNSLSGYCLDAGGWQATSAVWDVSCSPVGHVDEPRQSFKLVCAGDDTWRLVDRATLGYVAIAGTTLSFGPTLGGDEQRFRLEARPSVFEPVLATSEAEPGQTWRYVTKRPKPSWETQSFDDSSWSEGPGGFGDGLAISSPSRTPWTGSDIWLRRTFTLDEVPSALDLRVNHDDSVEIYINGIQAAGLANWTSGYRQMPLSADVLATLVVGANSIAVHCGSDSQGEQFIDVGLGHFRW